MLAPVDAPLGETREQYRIVLSSADKVFEYSADRPTFLVPAGDVAATGSGDIAIEVQQVGDFAASHPARMMITLS